VERVAQGQLAVLRLHQVARLHLQLIVLPLEVVRALILAEVVELVE
jgi:hypothetical protein